ncbi:hypothetical protein K458DRAFT_461004 [Lentithecium fluviatile CBS 122367]|uniref:Heterokaryon incompatibility domain-containing protein n=1 Tax=Lentithecium fluviatile CBS 122367 TaxID=1168545 RepID=A0A6G1IMK9_9PLEO|nr:hypothetical protein K458DRAFT_461004 [Lentithecium fluviatile CBS 122367]
MMGTVYKDSICNLAASSSGAGMEGFLPDTRLVDPTPVQVCPNWAESDCDMRRYSGKVYKLVYGEPWAEISYGSLYSRAWVVQEQILAPRALHFGREQIFWECNLVSATRFGPVGGNIPGTLPFLAIPSRRYRCKQVICLFKVHATRSLRGQSLHDLWKNIVRRYSTLELTYSSDRLPALYGIASELGQRLKSPYVFGLWTSDLPRGLLWQQGPPVPTMKVSYQIPTSSKPLWINVPSWSWASINAAVSGICSATTPAWSAMSAPSLPLSHQRRLLRPSILAAGS